MSFKPGDKVLYYQRDRNARGYQAKRFNAVVKRVGKLRALVEFEDGKTKHVSMESLELEKKVA